MILSGDQPNQAEERVIMHAVIELIISISGGTVDYIPLTLETHFLFNLGSKMKDLCVWDGVVPYQQTTQLIHYCHRIKYYNQNCSHLIYDRHQNFGSPLEAYIESLLTQLGDESRYAEYWFRNTWKHMRFHRDLSERYFTLHGEVHSPKHGHVLYLAWDEEPSPTLILDTQVLYSISPKVGRLLRFPGQTYHAAPNPLEGLWEPFLPPKQSVTRFNLMINTWDTLEWYPNYTPPVKFRGFHHECCLPGEFWRPRRCVEFDSLPSEKIYLEYMGDVYRRQGHPVLRPLLIQPEFREVFRSDLCGYRYTCL